MIVQNSNIATAALAKPTQLQVRRSVLAANSKAAWQQQQGSNSRAARQQQQGSKQPGSDSYVYRLAGSTYAPSPAAQSVRILLQEQHRALASAAAQTHVQQVLQ